MATKMFSPGTLVWVSDYGVESGKIGEVVAEADWEKLPGAFHLTTLDTKRFLYLRLTGYSLTATGFRDDHEYNRPVTIPKNRVEKLDRETRQEFIHFADYDNRGGRDAAEQLF